MSQKSLAVFLQPRAIAVSFAVFSAHVILLAVMLLLSSDPPAPRVQALTSATIMAQLLSPAAPAPPVVQPAPPRPQAKPKTVVQKVAPPPRPVTNPEPRPQPLPQPQPAAEAAPSAPATPAPSEAPAAAAAAAPAAGPELMAVSAPKNVSHLDCDMAKPEYPALSRRRGEAGTVYIRFIVGLTGKIEHAELKKSSGFSRLDNAALAAIRSTACHPYLENGEPIRVTYTQPYNFGLTD